jgi:hypothetical protein
MSDGEELWWHGELGGLVRSANEQVRMLEQKVAEWAGLDQVQGHGLQVQQGSQTAGGQRARAAREPHNATASTHMSGASMGGSMGGSMGFDAVGHTPVMTNARGRSGSSNGTSGIASGHGAGLSPSQAGLTPPSLHWTTATITGTGSPSEGSMHRSEGRLRHRGHALSHTHPHLQNQQQSVVGTPRGQTVSFSSPIAVVNTPTTQGSEVQTGRSNQDMRGRQSTTSSIDRSRSKGVRWEASPASQPDEPRQLRCGKAEAESKVATGSAVGRWMASEKQARDWMSTGEQQ